MAWELGGGFRYIVPDRWGDTQSPQELGMFSAFDPKWLQEQLAATKSGTDVKYWTLVSLPACH